VTRSLLALALLLGGCSNDGFEAPDRAAGARTPPTARCDEMDPTRCHLPWPSSSFLVADPATATGVHQHLEPGTYAADDDAAVFEQADGFSRISPLIVGSAGILAPRDDASVRLWIAEPGHPRYGEEIPLRVVVETDENASESLVVAYPRVPLPENAIHVAVAMAGGGLEPSPMALAALDRREPESQAEADARGYHAPTRAFLAERGVDAAGVARVWDFVTRSEAQVFDPLLAMRERVIEAVDAGAVFTLDTVEVASKPGVALIVEGSVELPYFAGDALPDLAQQETHVSRFRILVPEGSGDYPVILFGHGLGGAYDDPAFDEALAAEGLGKIGVDFHGWTTDTFLDTLGGMVRPYAGSAHAAGLMMQALAELSAIQHALSGPLGDVLAADTVAGMPNPTAGRRPDMANPMYGGGSLGGTMGFVYANMDPLIHYGALNVGGAGWTHFLRSSTFFAPLDALMRINLGSSLDVTLVVAQGQTNMDFIDGGVWADHRQDPPVLLIQESIGDTVLPNIGSELMARSAGAVRVGALLDDFAAIEQVNVATEQSALTQYHVTAEPADVHGFGITDTPAGDAAREQIRHFFATAQERQAEIIVPTLCPNQRCDFTD
jgi:hypothetical protein